MKALTPQEKKELSYQKDRRNCYGESPHGARKAIPLNKRLRNCANRKYAEQQLALSGVAVDDEQLEQAEDRLYQKAPKVWSKTPDETLKEAVAHKHQRREVFELIGPRKVKKK